MKLLQKTKNKYILIYKYMKKKEKKKSDFQKKKKKSYLTPSHNFKNFKRIFSGGFEPSTKYKSI